MTTNKCYDCVHHREVPGSAHLACAHPVTAATRRSPFMALAGIVGKRGGDQLMAMASTFDEGPQRAADALHIRANYHGVRNGWFVWPVNFDPTWLENCDGFEAPESATSAGAVARTEGIATGGPRAPDTDRGTRTHTEEHFGGVQPNRGSR